MIERLRRLVERGWQRIGALPIVWKLVLGGTATAIGLTLGLFSYRLYDYVQHDNEFCLSCHLMVEPFERFTRSPHRDLSCKACHHPTLVERSKMALTQIIENPEAITQHADVPNEACAACHVEGDPVRWRVIANTVGHRVHLESTDPSLEGLRCVQCHSVSIHEFAPVSRTCAQTGCHERTGIVLGRMAQEEELSGASSTTTLHCTLCHNFLAEPRLRQPLDTARAALTPAREECLACHAMRRLLDEAQLAGDPHGAVCGACHDPHTQRTPAAAVQSCDAAGCHVAPDTITPLHRGLDPGVLDRCTTCHDAHVWRVGGIGCLGCHSGIFAAPAGRRPGAAAPAAQAAATPEGGRFNHRQHRPFACTACHDTVSTHGGLAVRTRTECMNCHHSPALEVTCTNCHAPAELAGEIRETVRYSTSVAPAPQARAMPFRHTWHTSVACRTCHNRGPQLGLGLTCMGCHEQHHQAERQCRLCHQPSPIREHDRAAHGNCLASGCHQDPLLRGMEASSREYCLVCHQQQVLHEPGMVCVACHVTGGRLPRARGEEE